MEKPLSEKSLSTETPDHWAEQLRDLLHKERDIIESGRWRVSSSILRLKERAWGRLKAALKTPPESELKNQLAQLRALQEENLKLLSQWRDEARRQFSDISQFDRARRAYTQKESL